MCDKILEKVLIADFATPYSVGAFKFSIPAIEDIKVITPELLIKGEKTLAEFKDEVKLIS